MDYQLPFVNICCRARVRVVDFFPPDLRDFAVPRRPSEYDVLSESDSDSNESDVHTSNNESPSQAEGAPVPSWEWRFYLLVEDALSRPGAMATTSSARFMRVLVAEDDAVFLLRMDAKK